VLSLVALAMLVVSAKPAISSGPYEDFGRFSSFLVAPQLQTLDGRFTRADAPDNDALIITLSGRIPYRSFLLVQPELSYVSMTTGGETLNTAGDLKVRARLRMWKKGGAGLYFVPGVRTGSGSADAFPYSTASIDIDAGLAFVDTLTDVAWWLSTTAVYATRVDDALKDSNLYGNYATASFGAMLPPTERILLMAGVTAVLPQHETAREVYFLDGEFEYSPSMTYYVSLQAEAGSRANRAINFAVGGGVRLTF
jgi:hypothetical protein